MTSATLNSSAEGSLDELFDSRYRWRAIHLGRDLDHFSAAHCLSPGNRGFPVVLADLCLCSRAGTFRRVFKGNYSVPLLQPFVRNWWALVGIAALTFAVIVSFRSLWGDRILRPTGKLADRPLI